MGEITFEGGLNEQDSTAVNPQECVEGYNFEIQNSNTHLQPRPPFERQGLIPLDISTISYSSKNKDISLQDANPTGLEFNPDGTIMYMSGVSDDTIFQYALDTPWDVGTAVYSSKFLDIGLQDGSIQDIRLNNDGTKAFVLGDINDKIFQYTLSPAWDISTGIYDSKSLDISLQDNIVTGFSFNNDGTIVIVAGRQNDKLYEYILTVPFDISTASYSNKSFDISSESDFISGMMFNSFGTTIFIVDATTDLIYQYNLSTAFDISTAIYSNKNYDATSLEPGVNTIGIGDSDKKIYISGNSTSTVYQYSFSGDRNINGFIQLITSSGVKNTLVQGGNNVYDWNGSTTYTLKDTLSADSRLRGVNWTLGDYSIVVDLFKNTVVKKWDGTSFTTLTTGLGTSLKAKYAVVYLGRVWLFNVESGVDTPHLILASAFENPESYDTSERAVSGTFATGLEAFYITVPNLKPINGVALFYDTLVISTVDGVLYKLIGSDADTFQILPYYAGSSAVGTETFSNIGNDVVYMRQSVIESLRTTDTSGDVATDDISKWIRQTVEGLTDAITVYDRDRQKVYFFIGNNKVLVLFKNKINSGFSPWSVYSTNHISSFQTNAAIFMKDPATGLDDNYIYFGDDSGNIYHMDGDVNGDNGDTDIQVFRRSRYFESDQIELEGINGRVYYKRVADTGMIMQFEFGDDYSTTTSLVPLEGPPTTDNAAYWGGNSYWSGEFYWNAGFKFSTIMTTKGYSPVGKGTGIHMLLTFNTRQTFDVVKITDEP